MAGPELLLALHSKAVQDPVRLHVLPKLHLTDLGKLACVHPHLRQLVMKCDASIWRQVARSTFPGMAASHPALQPHASIDKIIAISKHRRNLMRGRISAAQFQIQSDWSSQVLLSPKKDLVAARTEVDWGDEEDEEQQEAAINQQLGSVPAAAKGAASQQPCKSQPGLLFQDLSSQAGSLGRVSTMLLPENCSWDNCDSTWGHWWPDASKLTIMFHSNEVGKLRFGVIHLATGSIQPCSVHDSWDVLCYYTSGRDMNLSPNGQYISARGPWQLEPRMDSWTSDTMRIYDVIQGRQTAQLRSLGHVWSPCGNLVAVRQYVEDAEWHKEIRIGLVPPPEAERGPAPNYKVIVLHASSGKLAWSFAAPGLGTGAVAPQFGKQSEMVFLPDGKQLLVPLKLNDQAGLALIHAPMHGISAELTKVFWPAQGSPCLFTFMPSGSHVIMLNCNGFAKFADGWVCILNGNGTCIVPAEQQKPGDPHVAVEPVEDVVGHQVSRLTCPVMPVSCMSCSPCGTFLAVQAVGLEADGKESKHLGTVASLHILSLVTGACTSNLLHSMNIRAHSSLGPLQWAEDGSSLTVKAQVLEKGRSTKVDRIIILRISFVDRVGQKGAAAYASADEQCAAREPSRFIKLLSFMKEVLQTAVQTLLQTFGVST